MKHFLKISLLLPFLLFCLEGFSQFDNVTIQPFCWNGDSTIWGATYTTVALPKPDVVHYFDYTPASGETTLINVASGTIEPGPCLQDDSTFTLIQEQLLDNDTLIADLKALLDSVAASNIHLSNIVANTTRSFAVSPVCWDSSGTLIPLNKFVQVNWANSSISEFYLNVDGDTVIINEGTVSLGHCPQNTFVVEQGCYSTGEAWVDLAGYKNGPTGSSLVFRYTDGTLDTIGPVSTSWTPNILRIVLNNEGPNLCTSGSWTNNDDRLTVTGFITNYDSLIITEPRQAFPFYRTIQQQIDVEIVKEISPAGTVVDVKAYSYEGDTLYSDCGVALENCPEDGIEKYQGTCVDLDTSLSIYTLLTDIRGEIANDSLYGETFTRIGSIALNSQDLHPVTGDSIYSWQIYAVCSDTLPAPDPNGNAWLPGTAEEYDTSFTFLRLIPDPVCGTTELVLNVKGCNDDRRDTFLEQLGMPELDSLSTEIIADLLTDPTFPDGVDELVVFNTSTSAFVELETGIGAQTIPPNGTISIFSKDLTFSSISTVAGTFSAGDELVFNYAIKR